MKNKFSLKKKSNLTKIKNIMHFFIHLISSNKINKLIIIAIILLSIYITNYSYSSEYNNINTLIVSEEGPTPEVYFCGKDNCTKVFLDLITKSSEVKCALYDLDLPEIITALKEKNAEIYIEEDNKMDEFNYGYSPALMHNKFCIFDKNTVMTGSFNPTRNGAYKNNNNILVLESKYLVENYLSEFDEIKNNIFGKGDLVKYPIIKYNNYTIQNYFCPEDNCQKHVLYELEKAKKSIVFMTFSFTDNMISSKLVEKNNLGIDVKGLMEAQRTNMQYNQYKYLTANNLTIYKDINPNIMHHKIFVIDNNTVILGSYNPTGAGATKNDENILIINNKEIAMKYLGEFQRLTLDIN